MKTTTVTAPDGVSLVCYEYGNPGGPEILFIHGYNQAALSWARQVEDAALLREFRMVAFDLRGHGSSGKPPEAERYTDDRRWADDVAAVIAAAGLRRPVLVPWSYGGRVVTDYVRHHGQGAIAGINFVAASTKDDPAFQGPGLSHAAGMMSDDLATNIAATRAFVRACFKVQPEQADFETMLAFNMAVPPGVRKGLRSRTINAGDVLPTLRLPALVTHGTEDAVSLVARSHFTAGAVPGATLSLYEGIGHAPFWEDTPRFNRELAAFVRAATA